MHEHYILAQDALSTIWIDPAEITTTGIHGVEIRCHNCCWLMLLLLLSSPLAGEWFIREWVPLLCACSGWMVGVTWLSFLASADFADVQVSSSHVISYLTCKASNRLRDLEQLLLLTLTWLISWEIHLINRPKSLARCSIALLLWWP